MPVRGGLDGRGVRAGLRRHLAEDAPGVAVERIDESQPE